MRWNTEKLSKRLGMVHRDRNDPEWMRLWEKTWSTMAPHCSSRTQAKRMALDMMEVAPDCDPESWAKMMMGE